MQPPPATPCPPGGPTIPDDVLEAVAAHFHALGEPTRLALLQWLAEGEHTVGDLARRCGCSPANVSRHLALLMRHGLVQREQRGHSAWYRCAEPRSVRCATACAATWRGWRSASGYSARTDAHYALSLPCQDRRPALGRAHSP